MFFSISNDKNAELGFNNVYHVGNFVIHTDSGWNHEVHRNIDYIYKGYVENGTLDTKIQNNDFNNLKGNYCVFAIDNKELKIYHNLLRTFPIYRYSDKISNIDYGNVEEVCYCDAKLTIDSDSNITDYTSNDIIGDIPTSTKTEEEVIDEIDQIMLSSFENFFKHNKLPVKIWLSGGVDTTLMYSYLQKYCNDYEVLNYEHIYFDKFWCCNKRKVEKNWAYQQCHHFKEDCVLVSGALGDEFMMRNPTSANLYLSYYGVDILDYMKNNDEMYHTKHFLKEKNIKRVRNQEQQVAHVKTLDEVEMRKYICNILANDYQHHHIGNTLSFTPLRDINIMKLLMQLPIDVLLKQISDAYITKKLIQRHNPQMMDLISPSKNANEDMCHLHSVIT